MHLVKYCKSEFNPLNGCQTIQLGTPQYYREMNPDYSVADAEDGLVSIIDPVNHVHVLYTTMQNSYIFCVSTTDMSTQQAETVFKGEYDSRYYLRYPVTLTILMLHTLKAQVRLEDFTESAQISIRRAGGLAAVQWRYVIRSVTYSDDVLENEYGKEIEFESYDLYIKNQFRKRHRYTNDTEVRFLFLAVIRETDFILSVNPKPIRLEFKGFIWDALSKNSIHAEEI